VIVDYLINIKSVFFLFVIRCLQQVLVKVIPTKVGILSGSHSHESGNPKGNVLP